MERPGATVEVKHEDDGRWTVVIVAHGQTAVEALDLVATLVQQFKTVKTER